MNVLIIRRGLVPWILLSFIIFTTTLIFGITSRSLHAEQLNASNSTPSFQATYQEPLTLERAIEEGLARSPKILREQAIVGEKSWGKFESLGSGFLPQLSLSGSQYFGVRYTFTTVDFGGATLTLPGFFPNTQAALNVSIPLFNGLANVWGLQSATLIHDASQQELSYSEFQLSQEIRLAFYQALAASQLEAVANQNVKTLEDHLNQIKIHRAGGTATNYDTLRVEVQLSEARADAIDAQDSVILTRKKLSVLLGLRNDERQLQGELPTPDISRIKKLELSEDVAERADIQALNFRAEAANRQKSAKKAWLVPSVNLAGQYLVYNSQILENTSVTNTGIYRDAYNMGIFVKWNLFDGGVALAQAHEAAYQAIQAEKAAELAKIQVPYDFAYWKRRYLSNSDHYLSKKFDITRSEESVRLSKEEERAGTRTSTETLDAELDLFRAKAGVVNAQVNAVEAQIKLELTIGRRI